MQVWKERIDQRGAAGRPLLMLRVAQLPAPRALFSIIRTPLLPLRRTVGDILPSNNEVERRAGAPTLNETDLSQSSTPLLGHRSHYPRDRSNRWLADQSIVVGMGANPKPKHPAFNVFAKCTILFAHPCRPERTDLLEMQ